MKVIWLGQAGLLFSFEDKTILIDPYLSDSVARVEPHNKRRVDVDKSFFHIRPNIIILTHNHLDHTDPESLKHYLCDDTGVCVLASSNAWNTVRKEFGGNKNNYISFNRGTRWTEGNICIKAVYAEHSDDHAIGVIIEAEGKIYYITGDTLYNEEIFNDLPEHIDYVFLPVNGRGNNMNMSDAKAFCERISATAITMHCGLFDDIDMHEFDYDRKIVPEFFKEIKLI